MGIEESFKQNGIIPTVVAVAPKEVAEVCSAFVYKHIQNILIFLLRTFQVSYPSGATVKLGNELTPTNVKDIPVIKWNADPNSLYSLFLVHPNAVKNQEMLHWTVVNIPGSDIAAGESVFDFVGSGPPQSAGLLNYVFLIFKQDGKIDVSSLPKVNSFSRSHRIEFTIKDFTTKYNLKELVAGNFFQAQYDEYVNVLYSQFV